MSRLSGEALPKVTSAIADYLSLVAMALDTSD